MSVDACGPPPDSQLGPGYWRRWLPWFPSALLVLVALVQITLAHTANLDPWKGGGFGMFSTADRIGARQLRATALAGPREVPLRIPQAYQFEVRRAISMPTDAALENFAELLFAQGPPEPVRAIRVEVLRLVRDPETSEYSFESINARTKDRANEPR